MLCDCEGRSKCTGVVLAVCDRLCDVLAGVLVASRREMRLLSNEYIIVSIIRRYKDQKLKYICYIPHHTFQKKTVLCATSRP